MHGRVLLQHPVTVGALLPCREAVMGDMVAPVKQRSLWRCMRLIASGRPSIMSLNTPPWALMYLVSKSITRSVPCSMGR